MENTVDQPDFPLAVRSLETLTEQVARCRNLSMTAIDSQKRWMVYAKALTLRMAGGQDRLHASQVCARSTMRTINGKLDDVVRKVDALDSKVDGLDCRVQDLYRRLTAGERNELARMVNRTALRSDAGLAPLFSLHGDRGRDSWLSINY
ncbi:hypothetical protein CP532_1769 [Ophiocordyceps camponoti-leonardi (nom. inval.)]|nr:hypothetical protein CP532_1769 [Ophiocordyceps camponoti-leonardi (nom. inval.)]